MKISNLAVSLFFLFSLSTSFAEKDVSKGAGALVQMKTGQAYIAVPSNGSAPYPAVLIIPDAVGLSPYYVAEADAYAEMGIVAVVVDFNRGKSAKSEAEFSKFAATLDSNYLVMVIKAGFDLIKSRRDINLNAVALVGYGVPGQTTLKLIREQDIKGGVFVSIPPVMDSKDLLGTRGNLTFVYGEMMPDIPRSLALDFERMLTAVRIQAEIKFVKTDRKRWWDYSFKDSYDVKVGTSTRQLVVGSILRLLMPGRVAELLPPSAPAAPPSTQAPPDIVMPTTSTTTTMPSLPTITSPPTTIPGEAPASH